MTTGDMTPGHQDRSGHVTVIELAIMATILVFLSLAGTVGNSLTCIIFAQNRGLRTASNILIVNLAIADVLQSLNIIFMIISLLNGRWVFSGTLCQFCGWSNITFIVTSLLSLALISLNRYYLVVKTSRRHFFTARSTLLMIVMAWSLASLIALAPVLGWSVYDYQPGKLMCTLQFSKSYSFTATLMLVAIGMPFSILCYTTRKIIKHIKASNARVAKSTMMAERKRREENRISWMLLSVIFCFVAFYSPASILNFVQMGYGNDYSLPFRLDVWSVILAMFNHVNNPIIYCILNSNFRQGFRAVCSAERRRQNLSGFETTKVTARKTGPETA